MPRPKRIMEPGYVMHIICRGNNKQTLFKSDGDYRYFCAKMALARKVIKVRLFNFVLMPNHIHLLMEALEWGAISRLMQVVLGAYAERFNERYDHVGHVFQGRFKALIVQEEAYFMRCMRYIDLNAPKAGIVRRPEAFAYSGCAALTQGGPTKLKLDEHPLYLGLGKNPNERRAAYAEWVHTGWDDTLDLMKRRQNVLGDGLFRASLKNLWRSE